MSCADELPSFPASMMPDSLSKGAGGDEKYREHLDNRL